MKTIGFFVRHFSERGTEVAIYDYAHYNETILSGKSYIICFTEKKQKSIGFDSTRVSYQKFRDRFTIIEIDDISDMKNVIEKYNLNYFYTLTYGNRDIYQFENKEIWNNCKTIKHCVFDTGYKEADYYIAIGDYLNEKCRTNIPVIPHIVSNEVITIEDLRNELNIPKDSIVIGRYGGYNQFNLSIVHIAIKNFLLNDKDTYFLFMNTEKFYEHPKIIYLPGTSDNIYKSKFINTCNAMIHARADGETFGLSIGEFSVRNKPIITCPCGDLEHIKILGDKAVLYNTSTDLLNIFSNIIGIISSRNDWNAYDRFSPEKVMKLFNF